MNYYEALRKKRWAIRNKKGNLTQQEYEQRASVENGRRLMRERYEQEATTPRFSDVSGVLSNPARNLWGMVDP